MNRIGIRGFQVEGVVREKSEGYLGYLSVRGNKIGMFILCLCLRAMLMLKTRGLVHGFEYW